MAEQNMFNTFPEANVNNFWLTCPPPNYSPSQPMTPIYNLEYRMPFIHSHKMCFDSSVTQINSISSYNCIQNDLNYQNHFTPISYNSSADISFPPLPDSIDEKYIYKYISPVQQSSTDTTSVWIKNWLSIKEKEVLKPKTNIININEISNKIKTCKTLLENLNNNKHLMEKNISTMTTTEWTNSCSNLFFIKEQVETIIKTFNFDNKSICEIKFKLNKRYKKRHRLKRLKSELKMIKLQKQEEIKDKNQKIEAWQSIFKENILKEKRTIDTRIEANTVMKGVRGKIDDAKNQLSLLDTLEKLRKCRLQNCVNKRKNPLLEESLNKLKMVWQQKLTRYHKEEESLKSMLTKAEVEKHKKKEIEIQEKLLEWNQILFGSNYRSSEVKTDNLNTFLDTRRDWDNYITNETSSSSSIPIGWIVPLMACNSDWAKYSNVNMLEN